MQHLKKLVREAKYRAQKKDLDFDITYKDLSIPYYCPVLQIELNKQGIKVGPNSPSLDRIDPTKGYVKGNVQVISHLANTMKSNATPEQLLHFADWIINNYSWIEYPEEGEEECLSENLKRQKLRME